MTSERHQKILDLIETLKSAKQKCDNIHDQEGDQMEQLIDLRRHIAAKECEENRSPLMTAFVGINDAIETLEGIES